MPKPIKKLILLFMLCLWNTACSQKLTQVSFMVFGDAAEYQAYVELVETFTADHPDIHIEVTHIPSQNDYRTRLATDYAAGTPPDISLMNYRRIASFAAAGLLQPLDPFFQNSQVIQLDDFYPIALEAFTWNGELVCLPQNVSSQVVYYNLDLFDAAGVPYPPDKWTWEDFVTTAELLTLDKNGDGQVDQYGLGIEPSLIRLAPYIWQNEGLLVDDEANPTQLTLTRFPSLQALQWFVELRQVHGVVPDRIEEASQDSQSRFVAGLTAMYVDSRRVTPTFREIEDFRWDVAPLPNGKTSANVLHSDGYCLSATAENPQAAWAFIEFANSVAGQTIVAKSGRTVPSLMAVAQSEAFLDSTQAPSRSQVWLDNAAISHILPVISTWDEIEGTADQEIERVFYGDIDPTTAAQLAVQRTEEYFLLAASEP